ncbi:MAG: NAD-dependent epimerase/dehydratase family protein [Planctomycetes bacterium]|nr:NAD-dependent epimerase/dehydratase family protein [Planctomycetota bacterium]
MKVLVTGGTGFLGRHVVRELVGAGHEVRALVRNESYSLQREGASQHTGDVLDPESVRAACEAQEAVIHLAGLVDHQGEPSDLYHVHVEGTRHVVNAAADAGVGRMVHMSSSGVTAVSTEPDIFNETSPYALETVRRWPYYLSKIFAEKVALEAHANGKLPVIVLNPSLLLGPDDERFSSSDVIMRFLRRELAAVPPGGLNFVDVRDCARACRSALSEGRPGERYLLGGPNMTFGAFFELLGRVSDVPVPTFTANRRLGTATAKFLGGLEAVGGLEGDESVAYAMASHFWYLDANKARRELNFRPTNPEATLRDAVKWIRSRGPLERSEKATFGGLIRDVQRLLGRA